VALSLDANRHAAWLGIAGAAVLAHTLDGLACVAARRRSAEAGLAVGCVLLLGATVAFGNVYRLKPDPRDRTPLSQPAVEFLRRAGYTGNVFNTYIYGGKLAYHFYPQLRIGMDDRIDAYGEDLYREFTRYEGIRLDRLPPPAAFVDYFERNRLDTIVVRTLTIEGWRRGGQLAALTRAGWKRVYADRWCWILHRDAAPTAPTAATPSR